VLPSALCPRGIEEYTAQSRLQVQIAGSVPTWRSVDKCNKCSCALLPPPCRLIFLAQRTVLILTSPDNDQVNETYSRSMHRENVLSWAEAARERDLQRWVPIFRT
jgi:hypothetical protein